MVVQCIPDLLLLKCLLDPGLLLLLCSLDPGLLLLICSLDPGLLVLISQEMHALPRPVQTAEVLNEYLIWV